MLADEDDWERNWRGIVNAILSSDEDPRDLGYGSVLNAETAEPYETLAILRRNARFALECAESGDEASLARVHVDMLEVERRIISHELEDELARRPLLFARGWNKRCDAIRDERRRYDRALAKLRQGT